MFGITNFTGNVGWLRIGTFTAEFVSGFVEEVNLNVTSVNAAEEPQIDDLSSVVLSPALPNMLI